MQVTFLFGSVQSLGPVCALLNTFHLFLQTQGKPV